MILTSVGREGGALRYVLLPVVSVHCRILVLAVATHVIRRTRSRTLFTVCDVTVFAMSASIAGG